MIYMVRPLDKAIKAVLDVLKVPYEKTKEKDGNSPYNPEFVKKILQGTQDIKDGKGIKMNVDDLWK